MKRLIAIASVAAVMLAAVAGFGLAVAQPFAEEGGMRFLTVDVFVESNEPLAAWQFELTDQTGAMAIVGIENGGSGISGGSAAFADVPHYDRDVTTRTSTDRIIVADYSLADQSQLPRGRTRVATLHVSLSGSADPEFELELIAAGNAGGEPIAAAADYEIQNRR